MPIEETRAEYLEQLDRELASPKTFDGTTYRASTTGVEMGVVLFGAWALLINNGSKYNLEPADRAKVAALKRRVSQIQIHELPKLRAAWARLLQEKFSEDGLLISTTGIGHRTLRLTGPLFASDANIQQVEASIHDLAVMLRFRRIEYRWYRDADESYYYTLESPPDGEVRTLGDHGFAPRD